MVGGHSQSQWDMMMQGPEDEGLLERVKDFVTEFDKEVSSFDSFKSNYDSYLGQCDQSLNEFINLLASPRVLPPPSGTIRQL